MTIGPTLLVLTLLLVGPFDGKWAGTLDTPLPTGETYHAFIYMELNASGDHLSGRVGEAEDRAFPISNGKVADETLTFEAATPASPHVAFRLTLLSGHLRGEAVAERGGSAVTMKVDVAQGGPVLAYLHGVSIARGSGGAAAASTDAEAAFREAIRADGQFVAAYVELGRLLLQADRVAEAIPALEKAIQVRPEYRAAYAQLALAYRRAQEPDKAADVSARLQKIIDADQLRRTPAPAGSPDRAK